MTLKEQRVLDLQEIEDQCENPTYTYVPNGQTYPCKGSVTEFKSENTTGGFSIDQMLSMTARLYSAVRNSNGTVTLTSLYTAIPKTQKTLVYEGTTFRIASVRTSRLGYMRIIAHGTTTGF